MDKALHPRRHVQLLNREGVFIEHFVTDRDEFPLIATNQRDRVFILVSTSEDGAIYLEITPWRISTKTLDKPKAKRVRPKLTAIVIPFPGKGGDNGSAH